MEEMNGYKITGKTGGPLRIAPHPTLQTRRRANGTRDGTNRIGSCPEILGSTNAWPMLWSRDQGMLHPGFITVPSRPAATKSRWTMCPSVPPMKALVR